MAFLVVCSFVGCTCGPLTETEAFPPRSSDPVPSPALVLTRGVVPNPVPSVHLDCSDQPEPVPSPASQDSVSIVGV